MIPLDFALGIAAGLTVAVVLYLALWWWARRTVSDLGPPPGALGSPPGSDEAPGGPLPRSLPPPAALGPPSGPIASAPPDLPALPPSGAFDGPRLDPAEALPVRAPPTEAVRLSQRIILHVYAQGELPPGAVAPPGLCQSGIGDALGVTQSGLAAVLRRLEAAGILATERGHVRGRDRRLKIYRLSSRGVQLARELRTRASVLREGRSTTPTASPPTSPAPLLRPGPSPRAPT